MPEASNAAEITSRILLETKAVLFNPDQPFTFTSGRVSPVYVDCRRLISFPRARTTLMDLASDLIKREIPAGSLDAVAGGLLAAEFEHVRRGVDGDDLPGALGKQKSESAVAGTEVGNDQRRHQA